MASEMGEYWRDVHEFGKSKRALNLESSTAILELSGVPFVKRNNGVHLIVANRWDFWPSTGLFIERITNRPGRGIKNLLRIAMEKKP